MATVATKVRADGSVNLFVSGAPVGTVAMTLPRAEIRKVIEALQAAEQGREVFVR